MKIGVEGNHIPDVNTHGVWGTLDFAKDNGLEGVFFKYIMNLSPTLDLGELKEVKARADELGLYLEAGIGRINPFNTAETPEIRALGEGDYLAGMQKQILACQSIDCRELWASTGAYKHGMKGYFKFDRFRTDAPWEDQLKATEKVLLSLKSFLLNVGCRINIETHEEVTSYELVRIVETVGPEVVGITFDTANVLARGEDPVSAAQRVAPYTHLTHIKDSILYFVDDGLERQVRPCGRGIVNFEKIIPILYQSNPDLHLSIEDQKVLMRIQIYDPLWRKYHPDLNIGEIIELIRLAKVCENRIEVGDLEDPYEYETIPFEEQKIERLNLAVNYLRGIVSQMTI